MKRISYLEHRHWDGVFHDILPRLGQRLGRKSYKKKENDDDFTHSSTVYIFTTLRTSISSPFMMRSI